MDADRFDTLTRTLVAAPTRRAALRLLVGGLLGVISSLQPGRHTARGQVGGPCEGIPPCPWPQVGQQCCDEHNGYVCTPTKVCCLPDQQPCGGAPGDWGCCCNTSAGEECNPDFDNTPGSECCPCKAGRVRCVDECCARGERCDPATLACALCPEGQPACGFFCCPDAAYECVDGACRCPDAQQCGDDVCCPKGQFCCHRERGLCCPADAECCNPDAEDAVCCSPPNQCAKEGFPIPPGARRICCPPERHGGGTEDMPPEFCCAEGLVAADILTPNGMCCEPQSLCDRICCSTPGSSFPAVCCGGECCGPAPEIRCCDAECHNTRLDRDHCGECGNRCPDGQECDRGVCRCPDGGTVCDGVCTDTRTDRANCGACGNACGPGRPCCGGKCIDTNTNKAHCGRCGKRCPRGKRCRGGRCR